MTNAAALCVIENWSLESRPVLPIATHDRPHTIDSMATATEQLLSTAELQRYARHLILPEFGKAGQEKLKQSSVLCVGAGGLGSPLAMYLAAAGVGRIGIVDFDVVDVSNLQRQVIHGESSLGELKTASASRRIKDINPHVEITIHETALSSANAREIIRDYDVIADGTDNFPTRYLVNDACVLEGKPNAYASIDPRSLWLNFELTTIAYDNDLARAIHAMQHQYLGECSYVDPEAWRRRPLLKKLASDVAQLFSPLL